MIAKKTKYTKEEMFNKKNNFGSLVIDRKILAVKSQTCLKITRHQAAILCRIENICHGNRTLNNRFMELEKSGFAVTQNTHKNGDGVGTSYVFMKKDSVLRIRISGAWAGGYNVYSNCVHLKI